MEIRVYISFHSYSASDRLCVENDSSVSMKRYDVGSFSVKFGGGGGGGASFIKHGTDVPLE